MRQWEWKQSCYLSLLDQSAASFVLVLFLSLSNPSASIRSSLSSSSSNVRSARFFTAFADEQKHIHTHKHVVHFTVCWIAWKCLKINNYASFKAHVFQSFGWETLREPMQIFQVWPAERSILIWAWFHLEASHRVDQPGGRLDLQWKLRFFWYCVGTRDCKAVNDKVASNRDRHFLIAHTNNVNICSHLFN